MFLLWLRQLPGCGDRTPASVPPPAEGRSSPTNTPIFPLVPASYRVLCGSIHSFLLVRSFCQISAGVLHALLCLKVYSWCIRGEKCAPRPPPPPPSCSLRFFFWFFFFFYHFSVFIILSGIQFLVNSCWAGHVPGLYSPINLILISWA